MRNGFRTTPQPNKKDLLRQLATEVENSSMAVRLSQMMIKQLMENNKAMQSDLTKTIGQLNELQYKFLAIQRALNLDVKELDRIANEQRLQDFNDAAARADEREELETADVADAESTVTITSTTNTTPDSGIFRSRIKLSETGVPALIQGLTGKKVGDKVTVNLNDVEHTVELLAIKRSKVVEQQSTVAENNVTQLTQ